MKILCGNSNRPLAEAICSYLNMTLSKAVVRRFADLEIFVEIQENVRGEDVFVIQSTSFPANDHLMELLIIIDALRRASARRITAVLPYFGYAARTAKPVPVRRSRPSSWPISSPAPVLIGCSPLTCMPGRSRASSISRPTISLPPGDVCATSRITMTCATPSSSRPTSAAW